MPGSKKFDVPTNELEEKYSMLIYLNKNTKSID